MSYEQVRKNRKDRDQNIGSGMLSDDREQYPALCGGLDSYVGADGDKSTLTIQLYCRRGRLHARVEDREDGCQLFVELEALSTCFSRIESELNRADADWSPVRRRNGS